MFLVLKKFDWEGKFIVDPDSSTTGASVKLFSVNSLPHPWSDVEKLTLFHYKLGSFSNQENIFWTLKALQNSCDKELPMITDAKMLKYKASESFGPLYYYELVQQANDRHGFEVSIPDLVVGQSIAYIASTNRSNIIGLKMVNMVPSDIDAVRHLRYSGDFSLHDRTGRSALLEDTGNERKSQRPYYVSCDAS